MRTGYLKFKHTAAALAVGALSLACGQAVAAEYWLSAEAISVNMPNPDGSPTPVAVPMWGYASCLATFVSCQPATVPGPALTVAPGDTTLTVHLRNNLAGPTSLVVNGLVKAMTPVWDNNATGARPNLTARVRSFDTEAATGGGTADYTWQNVKPGTYLYQSGTQPQVQVQMGLYGALSKNFADASTTPAEVYAGTTYDNQVTLLYSEIDPALHAAVAADDFGAGKGTPSTLNYAPKYFLINGRPYPDASLIISPAGNPGVTLVRMLNAGLTTRVPMIQGTHWTVVAEDGKPYPFKRTQYTALLPAAKTMDALLTADAGGGRYPIIDRRLGLSNAGLSNGGMVAVLSYAAQGSIGGGSGSGNLPPVAADDSYASIYGVTFNQGAPGVLANDSNTDGLPLPIKAVAATGGTTGGGSFTLNTNGSFSYTPASGYSSPTDTFTYQVTDGSALAAVPATVTINLSTPAAPGLATVDDFNRANSNSLGTNWSQVVSTGAPGPDVRVVGNAAQAATVSMGGLALWNQATYGSTQYAAIDATPLEGSAVVLKATGGTLAGAPANYVRVRCEAGNVVIATMMGGSNASTFVQQAAFPAAGCSGNGTLSAVVDGKGLVTAFLGSSYVGGVQLPDVPAWKGTGAIGIQLLGIGNTVDTFSGGTLP